ncbi:hypothetical protein OIU77_000371 [Salix suchowensis]|uniref:Uncharacterized protein n=1 Tax=Salix suchowensis TaxID=1278906 RepID=A0ABQ9B5W3_9ROSI|nr:hypothetical protein OIU77_000371 [Salix suchowensis]
MEAELKEILNDLDSLKQFLPDPSSMHMVKCNCICLFSLLFGSITNNYLFTSLIYSFVALTTFLVSIYFCCSSILFSFLVFVSREIWVKRLDKLNE